MGVTCVYEPLLTQNTFICIFYYYLVLWFKHFVKFAYSYWVNSQHTKISVKNNINSLKYNTIKCTTGTNANYFNVQFPVVNGAQTSRLLELNICVYLIVSSKCGLIHSSSRTYYSICRARQRENDPIVWAKGKSFNGPTRSALVWPVLATIKHLHSFFMKLNKSVSKCVFVIFFLRQHVYTLYIQ